MRRALIPTALIALMIGGFTAASVIGSADPPALPHGILEPGGLAGVAGSGSVEHVKPDPQGKGPEWAVTVFRAKNGQTCVEPGRKQGNKAGDYARDGRFAPYPIEDGGSCTDLSVTPAGVSIGRNLAEKPPRTTVHGVAGPKVRQITLTVGGASQELAIGRRGAFFTVLDGALTPDDIDVSATLKDGSVMSLL